MKLDPCKTGLKLFCASYLLSLIAFIVLFKTLITLLQLRFFSFLVHFMMSDNITLVKQRECAVLEGEDEMYIVDIFSCAKPGEHHDYNESHKQLLLYITRAVGNNRSTFLQVFLFSSNSNSILDQEKTTSIPFTYFFLSVHLSIHPSIHTPSIHGLPIC